MPLDWFLPHRPRLLFHARQVPVAVDNGQDEYEVVLVEVHNPVALEDQLPDIFSGFSFRHFSSQFREIFQQFSHLKDTLYELPGIIRGILGDIGLNTCQILPRRFRPFNPHCPTTAFWPPWDTIRPSDNALRPFSSICFTYITHT